MPKNKRAIYSDLKKLDAHVVEPLEYAEAPELTDEEFAAATVRRGRPPSVLRKSAIKLRLDPDIVSKLRASGPGWQTRVNAALREIVLGLDTRLGGVKKLRGVQKRRVQKLLGVKKLGEQKAARHPKAARQNKVQSAAASDKGKAAKRRAAS
jgi:uncharacterized protein (DUF4415 family)